MPTMLPRRAPAPCPPCWLKVCTEWWKLSEAQARAWWAALHKSQWSRPASLRQDVLLWAAPGIEFDLLGFVHGTLNPARLHQVVEDLVLEGTMRRKEASAVQESLLEAMNARGGWI